MISNLIRNNYLSHLTFKFVDDETCIYKSLLKKLLSIEYQHNIINEDRYDDVIEYRKNYLIDNNIDKKDILNEYDVSILEVLIVLSIRIEDEIMCSEKYGDRSCQWFWAILQYAGLTAFYDDDYNDDKVEGIVYNWMNDKKPLWTQMMDILYDHNYFEEGDDNA